MACIFPAIAAASAISPPSPDASKNTQAPDEYTTVALQGLNKVTGHISTLEGPVGAVLRFGTLEIVAHRCWKSSPDDRPENAALLDISELAPGEPPKRIFLGWMFSSSPGLSGLEHPVYDITVLACATKPIAGAADKETEKKPAGKKTGKK
ncbi:MAG: DUF2155 domain-containing protein [Pseudomonadota bacterium]|nr:DUF2155 domain-containing protein [Pseudomonadota bacterium]MDE3038495.1 DUF2155 domain-containing protein [Pseudomonadota bacterium]